MPTIFDNVESKLGTELQDVMVAAEAADFCVGYFNLRGWGQLADLVDGFSGDDESCCRVLVGMYRPPEEEMREAYRAIREDRPLDPPTIRRLAREASESFKRQIEFGVPTDDAEAALRRLARQLRAGQVRVRLFLSYPIHAKLYMIHRPDLKAPLVGYVGSSNLTLSGLVKSGELNVDVVEQDAAGKLHDWFHWYWDHRHCLDITDELAQLIETSWATEEIISPYLVYPSYLPTRAEVVEELTARLAPSSPRRPLRGRHRFDVRWVGGVRCLGRGRRPLSADPSRSESSPTLGIHTRQARQLLPARRCVL